MSNKELIEEKKAKILIRLRDYKLLKREDQKDAKSFIVKIGEKKALIYCLPTQGTVGVAIVNQVKKTMTAAQVEKGILITSGRYTQAARVKAQKNDIELIPRIFPSFNLFDHVLVPKHEIVDADEREKLLHEYRVQPYQLPRLKTSDPAAKTIGAQPGDIVRILRSSSTSGKYVSYRYVVEG